MLSQVTDDLVSAGEFFSRMCELEAIISRYDCNIVESFFKVKFFASCPSSIGRGVQ